jgi:hypothetical protein
MPVSTILHAPLHCGEATIDSLLAAVRNVVPVRINEFAREDLAVVDDAIIVAVSGPLNDGLQRNQTPSAIVDVSKHV